MEFDRLAGSAKLRACSLLLGFVIALVGAPGALAQGITIDLVVTSPQAWAPQGSPPPHGVRVEPGRFASFSMRFENKRDSVMQRMLVIARTGAFPDPRAQYRFSDPRGPAECGEFLPFSTPLVTGYGIPIGPLDPRSSIECEWTVERVPAPAPQLPVDLSLSVSDCLFTPSAPNSRCTGPHIRFGDLPDLSMNLAQLSPIVPGQSREVRVRMTVENPTNQSMRPRGYGQCLVNTDIGFRNDFPGACARLPGESGCLFGVAYYGPETVPARSSASCELIVTTRSAFRDRQLIFFNPSHGGYFRNGAGAFVLDPNPGNEQTALELGDPPLPVDLFGGNHGGLLALLAALLLLVAVPRLRGLR